MKSQNSLIKVKTKIFKNTHNEKQLRGNQKTTQQQKQKKCDKQQQNTKTN